MSGVANQPGATTADIQAIEAKADAAQSTAQSADAKATAAGAKADQAMADALTGADRQQAVRVQVTPNAQGQVVFTYPKAYVAGTKPAIQTTAETPTGVDYRNDASVLEGSATNTQVTIIVQRVPRTLVTGVLGSIVSVFVPVTTPVWINIFIRAPV